MGTNFTGSLTLQNNSLLDWEFNAGANDLTGVYAIPEPTTLVLLLSGFLTFWLARRRRKAAASGLHP